VIKMIENDILEFANASKALCYCVDKLLEKNKIIKSENIKNKETYKKEIIEIHPTLFMIKNPKQVIFKHRKYKLMPYWFVSEVLTEMLGLERPLMTNYRKDIMDWSYEMLESGRPCYGYGIKWLKYNSFEKTIKRLKNNPTSKRCYIPIFDPQDLGDSLDAPCNVGFSLLCRDNKLDFTLFNRSTDIMRGWKNDIPLFSFIHQFFASCLGMELGNFYYFSNSLHIYIKDIDKLKALKAYLSYHEDEINELELDKNMEVGKFYDDLRVLLDIEVLSRNKSLPAAKEKLKLLNYKFARDFGRIYIMKNCGFLPEINKIETELETSIRGWYI